MDVDDTPRIQALRRIVDDKAAGEIDGEVIDIYTASLIIRIYDGVSDDNKARMADLTVERMVAVAYSAIRNLTSQPTG